MIQEGLVSQGGYHGDIVEAMISGLLHMRLLRIRGLWGEGSSQGERS